MANKITKTPVMVLQELTVRRALPPPEYNLYLSKAGTHENEFGYQVTVAGVRAHGIGRSKQIAKHQCARMALDLLAEAGIYIPHQNPVQDFNPAAVQIGGESAVVVSYNSVGVLADFCLEHKLPVPYYTEISDVGPPHCREFTYDCCLSSCKTRATAGTKKVAKHLAAAAMFERIKGIVNEKGPEYDQLALTLDVSDAQILEEYGKRSILNKIVPNMSVKVRDFDQVFLKIMSERDLSFNDVKQYLDEKSENSLKNLLQLLELEYEIQVIKESSPTILILNISTDTPFSILEVDKSGFEECKQILISRTFKYLRVMMQ